MSTSELPESPEVLSETKKVSQNIYQIATWSYRSSRLLSKGIVFWVLFSTVITQIESIVSISLYGYLINSITEIALQHSGDLSQLAFPFAVYSVVTLAIEGAKFGASAYIARIKSFAETALKSQFLAKLLLLSEKEINEVYTEEEVSTAMTDSAKVYQQFQSVISIFASAIIVLFVSVYLGQFSIWLPILLLPLSIIHFGIDRFFRKRSTKKTKEAASYLNLVKSANSFFLYKNGREQLRTLGAEQKVELGYSIPMQQYNSLLEKGRHAWNNATKLSNVLSNIIAILILSVVLYYSPSLMLIGNIYIQLRLVSLLRTKFDSIFSSLNAIEDSSTDVRKVKEILQKQQVPMVDETKVIPSSNELTVSLTDLTAPAEGKFGFTKLTWSSVPGVNAILTPKTHEPALLEMLLRARIKPLTGDITISSNKPEEISSLWLRQQVGFVSRFKLLPFLSLKDQADVDGNFQFQPKVFSQYLELVGMTSDQITESYWSTRPRLVSGKPTVSPFDSLRYLIARALYQQKKLIVIFMPQFKLLPAQEGEIMKYLKQLSPHLGVDFIVFCNHVVSLLQSDSVAWLWNGGIVEAGETSSIFNNPDSKIFKALQRYMEQIKPKEDQPQAA